MCVSWCPQISHALFFGWGESVNASACYFISPKNHMSLKSGWTAPNQNHIFISGIETSIHPLIEKGRERERLTLCLIYRSLLTLSCFHPGFLSTSADDICAKNSHQLSYTMASSGFTCRYGNQAPSISFSGSGFMATYQLGVTQCFLTYVPRILKTAPYVLGASAGSLVAAVIVCEVSPSKWNQKLTLNRGNCDDLLIITNF